MRGRRLIISLTAATSITATAAVPLVPCLSSDHRASTAERVLMARNVAALARRVIDDSAGPGGPPWSDLGRMSAQFSLDYAAHRSGGALTLMWVRARADDDALLGPFSLYDCYTVAFHNLGALAGTSRITAQLDCTTVDHHLFPRMSSSLSS